MRALGRLLVAQLDHQWTVREYIQKELRFQSFLSVTMWGVIVWFANRPAIEDAFRVGLVSDLAPEVRGAVITLTPLGVTCALALSQALMILCAINDRGYQFLPLMDSLFERHGRLKQFVEDEEGATWIDESDFVAELRGIQMNRAVANAGTNDRRSGYIGRSYYCFYACAGSALLTALHYGTRWQSLMWTSLAGVGILGIFAAVCWGKRLEKAANHGGVGAESPQEEDPSG